MSTKTAIVWFRQDLRLRDNPALRYAYDNGYSIIPVYILDDDNAGQWRWGGASRWWLHQSLKQLSEALDNKLRFYAGKADDIIPALAKEFSADAVFWNRRYEPWQIARDTKIKEWLGENNITAETFNASLLWEPWEIKKQDGTPYKVFTPFYRKGCLQAKEPNDPLPAPQDITFAKIANDTNLSDLNLMPDIQWYGGIEKTWRPGESGAQERLNNFLKSGLNGYKEKRNNPDRENVSRLSPHLHWGEISPRQVWHDARAAYHTKGLETDRDCFCSELGWREFSYSLLYYQDDLPRKPILEKFSEFPWADMRTSQAQSNLQAWKRGQTGIPIVDAGMRQLWQTGWMHNRVRMIVASVLIKNMLIHWHEGEEWFWDCLVDADLASNSASWQWVAGCGADAAPYFRIFNPVLQGEKFDGNGDYVRAFVPELKHMPDKYIHKPWEAPDHVLGGAKVTLGETYPRPVVDLKETRNRALAAYDEIK